MKYLFIDENHIEPYNGEPLKRYIGNRLVKAIANPTDEQLAEFGYKDLTDSPEPEYDTGTQYLTVLYAELEGNIIKTYEINNIENDIAEEVAE